MESWELGVAGLEHPGGIADLAISQRIILPHGNEFVVSQKKTPALAVVAWLQSRQTSFEPDWYVQVSGRRRLQEIEPLVYTPFENVMDAPNYIYNIHV